MRLSTVRKLSIYRLVILAFEGAPLD